MCPQPCRLASCYPFHSTYSSILDTFFLQVHAESLTSCTEAPQAGQLAPQCGCGQRALLPCALCSCPHTEQSLERGSNPREKLSMSCMPPGL